MGKAQGKGKGPESAGPGDREKKERMMGREKGRVDSERNHWTDSGPRPKFKEEEGLESFQ